MTTIIIVEQTPRPRAWMPMALAEVGRFTRNEAHIVVGRLESEGIPAVAFDTGSSIADGSWLLIPVRVMVDDEDLAEAQALLTN